jgi:hypothetical protein
MCEGPTVISSSPGDIRASSTISNYSDTSDGDSSDATPVAGNARRLSSLGSNKLDKPRPRLNVLPTMFAAVSLAAGMLGVGLWVPFVIVPEASTKTYEFAFWSYDPSVSHFDNSAWTYATDYVLAAIMAGLAFAILKVSTRANTDRLCSRASSLLILYMISTTFGGLCHQNYLTVESRNTLSFRLLWTLCVGTVSLANTSMGLCGTEIVRKFQSERLCSSKFDKVPLIPETFWWVYGLCITAFTAWGGMSFQRPACDIFIAGATQTPSTFYMMAVLYLLDNPKVEFNRRILGMIGFILNAPLLPMYPMLIQYTDWSLGSVNTLLHFWLTMAWSMQGYSMLHVAQSLTTTTANEKKKNL